MRKVTIKELMLKELLQVKKLSLTMMKTIFYSMKGCYTLGIVKLMANTLMELSFDYVILW